MQSLLVIFACMLVSCVYSHTFDLSSHMPDHLAIMFSMSWFGIPKGDPQGDGPDPSYGNWKWGGGCVPVNDPHSCDTSKTPGNPQRSIPSNRRPYGGIYSASARDEEGQNRVRLFLSNLRRPCDDGAKLDAWSVQINSIKFSSKYLGKNPQSDTADISYRALNAFYQQAHLGNMSKVILPGIDATWNFHFGKNFGLGKCDNSAGNPKQNCFDALQSDIQDMILMGRSYPGAAYTINGKPVVYIYIDAQYATPDQFNTLLNNARAVVGDFYVIASTQNGNYFSCFDAIAPWVNLGQYSAAAGNGLYAKASAWVAAEHEGLFYALQKNAAAYSGRVVFGGIANGFDDYTKDWGACNTRFIPRDPLVIQAQFDYLKSKSVKGVLFQTWDDWTEGSNFEPDVVGQTSALMSVRQGLGELYGEAANAAGDARLEKRWGQFGQARNCNGHPHWNSPNVVLTC